LVGQVNEKKKIAAEIHQPTLFVQAKRINDTVDMILQQWQQRFTETTHFNNFFKKHVELSPLKFRNAQPA
jgi:AraC-like DNA-binding protein